MYISLFFTVTENTDNILVTENTDNILVTENTDNILVTENTDNILVVCVYVKKSDIYIYNLLLRHVYMVIIIMIYLKYNYFILFCLFI
jgi:hypothetical protein